MSQPSDIVSDADIERVHAHANFGDRDKRSVVDEGILQYAFGYSTGHTLLCILVEHGLIRKPKPGSYHSAPTMKGLRYLRAVYGPQFSAIAALSAHPSLVPVRTIQEQ